MTTRSGRAIPSANSARFFQTQVTAPDPGAEFPWPRFDRRIVGGVGNQVDADINMPGKNIIDTAKQRAREK